MGIIAKNIVIGTVKPQEELLAPPMRSISSTFEELRQKQQEELKRQEEIQRLEEKKNRKELMLKKAEQPKYHEIHEGELHKLLNRKSTYLSDMAALED